jgi:hypothetical protein
MLGIAQAVTKWIWCAAVNLKERNLSGPVVSRLARISDSTLRQWRKRGFLPATKSPNAWPTFSVMETLRVAVIAELGRYGVDLKFAADMVEAFDLIDGEAFDFDGHSFNNEAATKRLRGPLYLRASQGGWVSDEEGNRHAMPVTAPKVGVAELVKDRRFTISDDPDDTVVIAVDVSKVFRRIEAELKGVI